MSVTSNNGNKQATAESATSSASANALPEAKEPSPSDIAKAIARLVGELEAWPSGSQRRVLEGTATALGIYRNKEPQRTQQRPRGNNPR